MTDHLRTPEAIAKVAAARRANIESTRRTTKPGSETCNYRPGTPVRIVRTGVSSTYAGRSGWVAVVNTQTFDNGLPSYTELGVTWAIAKDWERASADAWFRVDEVIA
jgi:hypothetical protein